MKALAVSLMLFFCGTNVWASDPYDNYLKLMKTHQLSQDFKVLAAGCGIDIAKVRPIYGVNVGSTWVKATDLGKAVYDTESDFFSSAELWVSGNKTRLVVLWSLTLDIGSEIESKFCLDERGKVRTLAVTQWSVPLVEKAGGWTYQQHETFDSDGKVVAKTGYFLDGRNRKTARPKLDGDAVSSFDWIPNLGVVAQIERGLRAK